VSLSTLHDESEYNAAVKKDSSLTTFAQQFNSVKYTRELVSGAGPYKLVDWVADQIVVLERKENYWGAGSDNPFLKAGPKRIIFHIIPDELNILNQLKSGEVDLAAGITSAEYKKLKESTDYADQFHFMTPEVLRFYFIMLNNTKPELADKNVRKALANLVDVEEIIEILEKGMAKRANGAINVSKPYFNNKLALVPEDIAKAESLLKNSGWTDTNNDGTIDKSINGKRQELELDMHTTGSNLSNKIALLVQESAKQVGIKINIIQKKYSLFKRENLAKLEYDMFTSSITQSLALDDPYMKWHSSNATPGGTNQSAYKSDKADKIIENIRDAKTTDQRNEQYLKLQEVMYEDQPVIFLYHPLEKIILSKKWDGKSTIVRPGYLANTFTPAS